MDETIRNLIKQHKQEQDLATPGDFTPPEELYEELLRRIRKYHPSDDLSLIEKAYHVAKQAHEGQMRKSGEPYIIHPICVAIILAELEMDKETIVAGLLHDVVEDTVMTTEDVTREFSAEVALLVDGVTKLTQLNLSQDKIEIQAENLRKMFLAMAKDIRVVIIKLADRLHNLRTLQYQSPAKQVEKARETMDIYSPIAHRLGISKIKIELDDLCMQYLYPDVYTDLQKRIDERLLEREAFITKMEDEVKECIREAGIQAEIDGRVKHMFSIYKKMKTQGKTLEQIYDLFALRIKVESVMECYAALGIIHAKYKPIPGRFKDYIAMPKANMYQSLHTTLIGNEGQPFEIQIRTYDMHRTAEFGIAAHWKYKESGSANVSKEEEKMNWLREILEWQNDTKDNREFMSAVKTDLDVFQDQVYVFTPAGDVKPLPKGSTPIDFAYLVHTAVGNTEILTSANSRGPSLDWLNIVKSTQAKTKINQWFRQEHKTDNIQRGKNAVEEYCRVKGLSSAELLVPEYMEPTLKKYNFHDWDSLMAAVGHGGIKEGQIVNRLVEEQKKAREKSKSDEALVAEIRRGKKVFEVPKDGIEIQGIHDIKIRFPKCCSAVPGDEIVGFITRGRGVSIHRTDCVNVVNMTEADRNRMIEATWAGGDTGAEYVTEIDIFVTGRQGILYEITKIFKEAQVDIKGCTTRPSKQERATITMQIGVKSRDQLTVLTAKIRSVEGVIDIERTTGG